MGSGSMLLAVLRDVLNKEGPEYLPRISLSGTDMDIKCCKMAVAQIASACMMNNYTIAELRIMHGNTLTYQMDTFYHSISPLYRSL